MTRLTFCLQTINGPFVLVEPGYWKFFTAPLAHLNRKCRTVAVFITHVFGVSVPPQVVNVVVCLVRVGIVASDIALRGRANESLQDKSVYPAGVHLPVKIEVDSVVAGRAEKRFKLAQCANTPCASVIAPLALLCPDCAVITCEVVRKTGNWVDSSRVHNTSIPKPTTRSEVIWFSPHCLQSEAQELPLFAALREMNGQTRR